VWASGLLKRLYIWRIVFAITVAVLQHSHFYQEFMCVALMVLSEQKVMLKQRQEFDPIDTAL
jgi:hypothetical protein